MASSRRPIVHLFVGLHKTGTTAARFMLDVHRELFERHGFYIPRATWTTYVNSYWNGGHNNIPWEICGNHATLPQYGTVADLVEEISQRPEHQHILLSEDLDAASPAHIDALQQAFAAFDVRVLIFIRNQVDWLHALFAEEQKWFGATTFETWYRRKISEDDRFDLYGLCRRWADAFGTVTVRCYEQIRGRLLDAFMESCDATPDLRSAFGVRSVPLVNVTLGELPLAMIRHASELAAQMGIDPSFFNAIIVPSLITGARAVNREVQKRPLVTPQVGASLFPLMKATNAALAAAFGVTLGPEYLDPAVPLPQDETPESPAFGVEELAKILTTTLCVMSAVASAPTRKLGLVAEDSREPGLREALREIAQRSSPWQTTEASSSPLLDELIANGLSDGSTALYLERKGPTGTAYRRSGGCMIPIRDTSEQEWHDLMSTLQFRAGLPLALGKDIRQGYVASVREGQPVRLWTRHALTDGGEVAILEPLDRCA